MPVGVLDSAGNRRGTFNIKTDDAYGGGRGLLLQFQQAIFALTCCSGKAVAAPAFSHGHSQLRGTTGCPSRGVQWARFTLLFVSRPTPAIVIAHTK